MREFKTKVGHQKSWSQDVQEDGSVSLVVISGSNLGEVFPLDNSPFSIGRNENSDIVSTDILTSRNHAQLSFLKEKKLWQIVDRNSTNGTYVNFKRIERIFLRTGDKISIGKTIFKFLGTDVIEKKFHDELYNISILDGLTQISSRSRFEECLEKAILGIRDGDRDLVLCLLDIDFFKKINDTYGHQAGDYVLREMTAVVKKVIRRQDIFARYGGEEFVLLLMNITPERAFFVAEKIRKTIESHSFEFESDRMFVTISVGLSVFKKGFDKEQFIAKADKNLYASKNQGRNRVTLSDQN